MWPLHVINTPPTPTRSSCALAEVLSCWRHWLWCRLASDFRAGILASDPQEGHQVFVNAFSRRLGSRLLWKATAGRGNMPTISPKLCTSSASELGGTHKKEACFSGGGGRTRIFDAFRPEAEANSAYVGAGDGKMEQILSTLDECSNCGNTFPHPSHTTDVSRPERSLYLMQHGQPALLFLVPGTLVSA